MDQRLEDIDPDARKAADKQAKEYAKAMKNSPDLSNAELMQEGLRRAAEEGDRQRAAEKERDDKAKAERKAKRDETAKRNSADTYRTQISQQAFDFSAPNPKGGSKGPSGGGGSGGMGTGKMNRDISKNMKKGGKVSSASKRADGCAIKGKTRGKMM